MEEGNKGRKATFSPLNHLLVEVIWKGPQGCRTSSRALSTCKHAVFIDQTTPADGDQGNTMTTRPSYRFISPPWTWFSTEMVLQTEMEKKKDDPVKSNKSASGIGDKSCSETSRSMNGWIEVSYLDPSGSQTTTSASAPGMILPFLG